MPSRITILTVCFSMFTAGVLSANFLVSALDLSLSTDRTYFVNKITQSIKPLNQQTAAIQHSIYQTRISYLKKQTETMELKTKSVQQYIEPLEKELNEYRMAFSEKAASNISFWARQVVIGWYSPNASIDLASAQSSALVEVKLLQSSGLTG